MGNEGVLVHNRCLTLLHEIQDAILTKDLRKALINGRDLIPSTWQRFSINKGMFYNAPNDKETYLRTFSNGNNVNFPWNFGKPCVGISKKIKGIEEFFDIDGNLIPRVLNPNTAQTLDYYQKTHILINEITLP